MVSDHKENLYLPKSRAHCPMQLVLEPSIPISDASATMRSPPPEDEKKKKPSEERRECIKQ